MLPFFITPALPTTLRTAPTTVFRYQRGAIAMTVTAAPPTPGRATLYVKADKSGTGLGDCPFSQKANLALRLKQVPVTVQYIDLSDKPDWYLNLNSGGSVPTFVAADAEVIDSSDEIVALADEIGQNSDVKLYDESSPHWTATSEVIAPVFSAFVGLLKNKDEELDEDMRCTLTLSLAAVDAHIASTGGPFLLGAKISAMDCNFAPKLLHVTVAGQHWKQYTIPPELTSVTSYLDAMSKLEEWGPTVCDDDTIIWGYVRYFARPVPYTACRIPSPKLTFGGFCLCLPTGLFTYSAIGGQSFIKFEAACDLAFAEFVYAPEPSDSACKEEIFNSDIERAEYCWV
jgi:glutathione dehydrogenase/transferase